MKEKVVGYKMKEIRLKKKPIMKVEFASTPERRLKEIAMPERRLKEKPVRKPTMRVIPMPERRLKVEFAQTRKKKGR